MASRRSRDALASVMASAAAPAGPDARRSRAHVQRITAVSGSRASWRMRDCAATVDHRVQPALRELVLASSRQVCLPCAAVGQPVRFPQAARCSTQAPAAAQDQLSLVAEGAPANSPRSARCRRQARLLCARERDERRVGRFQCLQRTLGSSPLASAAAISAACVSVAAGMAPAAWMGAGSAPKKQTTTASRLRERVPAPWRPPAPPEAWR